MRVNHVVISKQEKIILTPSTGKPVAELKPKHFLRRFDVTNIKKYKKMNHTSSTRKPVLDTKRTSVQQWITEFKEYSAVRKEDVARRQLIGNLVHQIHAHPKREDLVATPNFQVITPPERKYAVQSPCRAVRRAGVGSTHDVFFFVAFRRSSVCTLCR